jgi:hypothetical protein
MPLSSFPAFSSSSFLLCVFGLVATLFLMQEQRRILNIAAIVSIATLFNLAFQVNLHFKQAVNLNNPSTSYRFRRTAMIHSLPHALFTWALLLFAMQSFGKTFADFPLPMFHVILLPVAALLVFACKGIWKALHPRSKSPEGATQPIPIPSLVPALD